MSSLHRNFQKQNHQGRATGSLSALFHRDNVTPAQGAAAPLSSQHSGSGQAGCTPTPGKGPRRSRGGRFTARRRTLPLPVQAALGPGAARSSPAYLFSNTLTRPAAASRDRPGSRRSRQRTAGPLRSPPAPPGRPPPGSARTHRERDRRPRLLPARLGRGGRTSIPRRAGGAGHRTRWAPAPPAGEGTHSGSSIDARRDPPSLQQTEPRAGEVRNDNAPAPAPLRHRGHGGAQRRAGTGAGAVPSPGRRGARAGEAVPRAPCVRGSCCGSWWGGTGRWRREGTSWSCVVRVGDGVSSAPPFAPQPEGEVAGGSSGGRSVPGTCGAWVVAEARFWAHHFQIADPVRRRCDKPCWKDCGKAEQGSYLQHKDKLGPCLQEKQKGWDQLQRHPRPVQPSFICLHCSAFYGSCGLLASPSSSLSGSRRKRHPVSRRDGCKITSEGQPDVWHLS